MRPATSKLVSQSPITTTLSTKAATTTLALNRCPTLLRMPCKTSHWGIPHFDSMANQAVSFYCAMISTRSSSVISPPTLQVSHSSGPRPIFENNMGTMRLARVEPNSGRLERDVITFWSDPAECKKAYKFSVGVGAYGRHQSPKYDHFSAGRSCSHSLRALFPPFQSFFP